MLADRSILLIVGGGIAAYKSLELVRLLRGAGANVRVVLTAAGARFVTPLSLAALSEEPVYEDLWSLKDEAEMGHIRLSREADLIVVCPASADRLARMAAGLGGDLADAVLLAADKLVLAVPAMNHRMWTHPATVRNVAVLRADGVRVMEPDTGAMACGEFGPGRLPEPGAILEAVRVALGGSARPAQTAEGSFDQLRPESIIAEIKRQGRSQKEVSRILGITQPNVSKLMNGNRRLTASEAVLMAKWLGIGNGDEIVRSAEPTLTLSGTHALVTAGPTHEAIDPVRYLANRSSGQQGFAIAGALAALGARVTLIAGPVALPTPPGITRVDVTTAREMAAAVAAALPADVAVMVAAVADWGIADAPAHKLKKADGPPAPVFVPNPDILAAIAAPGPARPRLVVGFAAETADVEAHAAAKRIAKHADWIVGNDVSGDVMGGADNAVVLATAAGIEHWERAPKPEIARRLAGRIADALVGAERP